MNIIITEDKQKFQDYIHKNKLSIKKCIRLDYLSDICGKLYRLPFHIERIILI